MRAKTDPTHYSAIANQLRILNNDTTQYYPSEMAPAIQKLNPMFDFSIPSIMSIRDALNFYDGENGDAVFFSFYTRNGVPLSSTQVITVDDVAIQTAQIGMRPTSLPADAYTPHVIYEYVTSSTTGLKTLLYTKNAETYVNYYQTGTLPATQYANANYVNTKRMYYPYVTSLATGSSTYNWSSYSLQEMSFLELSYVGDRACFQTLANSTIAPLKSFHANNVSIVGASAFYGQGNLSIVDMSNVQSIGVNAFAYTAINTINRTKYPQLSNIGANAFSNCRNLNSVILNNNTTKTLGNNAFMNDITLRNVQISGLSTIPQSAFANCSNLDLVVFPNVTTINTQAFYNCETLWDVDFPQLTSIAGSSVFIGCYNLEAFTAPLLTSIANPATHFISGNIFSSTIVSNIWYWSTPLLNTNKDLNLASAIRAQKNLQYLTLNLGNYTSRSVTTGNTVIYASNSTNNIIFSYLSIPAVVAAHPGLSSISALTSFSLIYYRGGAKDFFYQAIPYVPFEAFKQIEHIDLTITSYPNVLTMLSANEYPWEVQNEYTPAYPAMFYLPATKYSVAAYPNIGALRLPNFINIPAQIATEFKFLTRVTAEECTGTIGEMAFAYCARLSSISVNCSKINQYAFTNCTSLTSISIPKCTVIESYAFIGCTTLPSINLPSCVELREGCFSDCGKLTSISLPKCAQLENYVFFDCDKLSNLNLPSVSAFSAGAFNKYSTSMASNSWNTIILGPRCSNILLQQINSNNQTIEFNTHVTSLYLQYSAAVCTCSRSSALLSYIDNIYVPDTLYNSYLTTAPWSSFSTRIKSSHFTY